MPLIECPACGRQISVEADACPQCGHPNRLKPQGLAWPFAIIATVIHAVLAFVLFFGLLFWVPRYEKIFNDFNMQLPAMTKALIATSRWLGDYWYVVIFPVGLLFAAGLWILSRLCRFPRSRRLGLHWLWFIVVTLLLLLASGTAVISIWLPYMKLNQGLRK
jgi:hypothetical protein